jgi:hypothetical protein
MKRIKRPEDLRVLQTICCREEIKYSLHRFSGDYATFYPFLCRFLSHMSYVPQHSLSNPIYHSTSACSLIQKSIGKVDPSSSSAVSLVGEHRHPLQSSLWFRRVVVRLLWWLIRFERCLWGHLRTFETLHRFVPVNCVRQYCNSLPILIPASSSRNITSWEFEETHGFWGVRQP